MTLFSETEQARIEACAVLHDIPAELLQQTLAERDDCQLQLPAATVFLDAGDVKPGLYLIA